MAYSGSFLARADEIFERALDLDGAARAVYLDVECGDDGRLRRLVERLLAAAERPETGDSPAPQDDPLFAPAFDGPLLSSLADDLARRSGAASELALPPLAAGARAGPYRVLEEIGRGGMGVVYLAERADGAFERRVALKVVRHGVGSDDLLERFGRERRILASLSDPGIAALLDAGTTAAGLPYVVLEHVEGEPLDVWADRRGLGVRERLELFLEVARAVAHAHAALVVHRDLKPSNILVTPEGRPKLLDFGIAKLLEGDDVQATRTGSRPMTPAYASPEQVRGDPVTTASDIYQLGMLLYLLLAGCGPYGRGRDTPGSLDSEAELVRAICQEIPAPPSSHRFARQLGGDLDTIVLVALRKDPARRYASVGQLMDDVERHLAGRPVSARPDSLAYRLSSFVRRHRAAVAAVLGVVGLIAVLVAFYTLRLADERDQARRSAERATEASTFLADLFRLSAPTRAGGREVTAQELLDRGTRWLAALDSSPELAAGLGTLLGDIHRERADYERARALLEPAVAELREMPSTRPEELAGALHALARLEAETARLERAETYAREALALLEAELGPGSPALAPVLRSLGDILQGAGRPSEAIEVVEHALALQRAALPPGDVEIGLTLESLGMLEARASQPDRARGHLRRARSILSERLGPDHPLAVRASVQLARVLGQNGEVAAAEELAREALPLVEEAWGDDHPEVAVLLVELASALRLQGEHDEARAHLERALAIYRAAHGDAHPQVAEGLLDLGLLERSRGDLSAAAAAFEESAALFSALLGPEHVRVSFPLDGLADVHRTAGEPERAIPLYERVLHLREVAERQNDSLLIEPHFYLGTLLLEGDDPAAAEPHLSAALAIAEQVSDVDESLAFYRLRLARCLVALEDLDGARELLRRVDETVPEPTGRLAEELRDVRRKIDGGFSPRLS